jgi:hypothetical protein
MLSGELVAHSVWFIPISVFLASIFAGVLGSKKEEAMRLKENKER